MVSGVEVDYDQRVITKWCQVSDKHHSIRYWWLTAGPYYASISLRIMGPPKQSLKSIIILSYSYKMHLLRGMTLLSDTATNVTIHAKTYRKLGKKLFLCTV